LKKSLEKTGIDITEGDVDSMMGELKLKNPNQVNFKDFCSVIDSKN
jgi:hypothetical protein